MITVALHWHYIFPLFATFIFLKNILTADHSGPNPAGPLLAVAYFGTPYAFFWLVYLLILHW